MAKSRFLTALGALVLCVPGYAFTGWGNVFPPLSPEDVEMLGAAADATDDVTDGDRTMSWENPRTGTHGTVEALERFERDGRPCRNYRLFIKVRGYEPFHATPVMCETEDGKWKFAAGAR